MSDLLKGLTGGGWAALVAWTFPSAIGVALLWFFVYLQMQNPPYLYELRSLTQAELAGAFAGLSIGLGMILNAMSTPLYRVLEGYVWPAGLCARAVRGQKKRRDELIKRVERLTGWAKGLELERLARFPLQDNQIVPSRLGNALRAFETYGKTRFNLDSQTMWSELTAVVPKSLQGELDRSRAIVDFFVALLYVGCGVGVLAIIAGVVEGRAFGILALGIVALASSVLWYNMAIVSSTYWSGTVRALVNLGRVNLADQMGLSLPDNIDAERVMWGHVTAFVYYGNVESARKLDPFRKKVVVTATELPAAPRYRRRAHKAS